MLCMQGRWYYIDAASFMHKQTSLNDRLSTLHSQCYILVVISLQDRREILVASTWTYVDISCC